MRRSAPTRPRLAAAARRADPSGAPAVAQRVIPHRGTTARSARPETGTLRCGSRAFLPTPTCRRKRAKSSDAGANGGRGPHRSFDLACASDRPTSRGPRCRRVLAGYRQRSSARWAPSEAGGGGERQGSRGVEAGRAGSFALPRSARAATPLIRPEPDSGAIALVHAQPTTGSCAALDQRPSRAEGNGTPEACPPRDGGGTNLAFAGQGEGPEARHCPSGQRLRWLWTEASHTEIRTITAAPQPAWHHLPWLAIHRC